MSDNSKPVSVEPTPGETLHSWKEIAVYLHRDVRTVQRWEKFEGLPVHRHWHKRLGSVFAYKPELDQWWLSHHTQLEQVTGEGSDAHADLDEPAEESRQVAPRSAGLKVAVAVVAVGGIALSGWLFTRNNSESRRVSAAVQPLAAGRVFAKGTRERGAPRIIPVPPRPAWMALLPDGRTMYVTHSEEGEDITVVNLDEGRVSARVKINGIPTRLAVSPDGKRVYAGVGLANPGLAVIETASNRVTHVEVGGAVSDIALTKDGRRLYLAMQHAGLKRLDTATLKVTPLPSVACPMKLALTPDETRLYVNYQCGGPQGRAGHDSIEVFDLKTERSIATITGMPNVGGEMRVSPDGAYLWVDGTDACAHPRYDHQGCPVVPGSVLNVIRTSDNKVVETLGWPAGEGAPYLTFSRDGSQVIQSGEIVRVLDAVNFATLEKMPLDSFGPAELTPDGRQMYVPLTQQSAIAVFDVAAGKCAPPLSPQAWWPADGSADDALGRGKGAVGKGVTFGSGRLGHAFSFNGVDRAELELAWVDKFTVSFWLAFNEHVAGATVVEKTVPAGSIMDGWRLSTTPDARLRLCRTNGMSAGCVGDALTSPTIADSAWYYVTITKDAERWALYLNGRQVDQGEARASKSSTVFTVALGGRGMLGRIDEFQIFGLALPPSDVAALYDYARCLADEP